MFHVEHCCVAFALKDAKIGFPQPLVTDWLLPGTDERCRLQTALHRAANQAVNGKVVQSLLPVLPKLGDAFFTQRLVGAPDIQPLLVAGSFAVPHQNHLHPVTPLSPYP